MQGALTTISFVVAITVIFCMAAAFGILFCLYGKYKLRSIENGLEDGELLPRLEEEFEKEAEEGECAQDWLERKNGSEKRIRVVMDAVLCFLILLMLSFSAAAIAFRAQGDRFSFGGISYFAIMTGSMEEKNFDNPYYERLPDNQIRQYSMIGIKKTDEASLELFDVVAFESGGRVYVHRIVRISEKDGQKLYTTMGDANAGSMTAEINMTFDKIIGRYNGFQSFGLGVLVTYLESNIGIISLLFAFLLLFIIDLCENRINKRYDERMAELAIMLDRCQVVKIETGAHPRPFDYENMQYIGRTKTRIEWREQGRDEKGKDDREGGGHA